MHIVLRIISLCLVSLSSFSSANKNGGGFKGMFIFGTSIVDNGNNNNLDGSRAKVNYLPYGIDFVYGPTGRFSNGKNIADLIGDYLKLPLIPSFDDSQRNNESILYGVNYGSAGSGILNETGSSLGKVISLHEQITNFERVTLPRLEKQLRRPRKIILANYLFLIAAGNNDYVFQLYPPGNTSQSTQSDAQSFATYLITAYSTQLKRLYKSGAKKFVLISPYPIGCAPTINNGQGCLPEVNAYVSVFFDQLRSKIKQMQLQMFGSQFILLNSVKVITDILKNGKSIGLSNVNDPCCELSSNGTICKENGRICDDRKSYAFFDANHYSESATAAIAAKVYGSRDASEIFPFNLYWLSLLNAGPSPNVYST